MGETAAAFPLPYPVIPLPPYHAPLPRLFEVMRILIVTGEASGDLHGAHLAKAIMALDPTAQLVGIGGSGMRAAGVSLVPGVPQLDVMGLIGLSAIRAMVQRVLAIRRA